MLQSSFEVCVFKGYRVTIRVVEKKQEAQRKKRATSEIKYIIVMSSKSRASNGNRTYTSDSD